MKRRRTGYYSSLTGGTGDVNPQLFKGRLATTTANQPISLAFINPVSKGIFAKTGLATVMEILKIWVKMGPYEAHADVAEVTHTRRLAIGTKDHGITQIYMDEPDLILYHEDNYYGAFTAGGTYGAFTPSVFEYDFTDNAGHGILVASDYIYVQSDTDNFDATTTHMFSILYRFKNVSIQEYVGIVQSQQ